MLSDYCSIHGFLPACIFSIEAQITASGTSRKLSSCNAEHRRNGATANGRRKMAPIVWCTFNAISLKLRLVRRTGFT